MKVFLISVFLCLLAFAYAQPRTLILLSSNQNNWWNESASQYESTLRQALIQAGFTILDQSQLQRVADRQLLTRIIQGDLLSAVTLATNFRSDAVVVSRVDTTRVLCTRVSIVNVCTHRALGDVKVILASTGQIVSSLSPQITGTGTSDRDAQIASLRALGEQAGRELATSITNLGQGSSRITLTVTGLQGFSDAAVLIREISTLQGVASAQRRSFANGVLEADINFTGLIDNLAAMLEGLSLIRLEITEVSGQAVEARVRR
jgi:hypothetical protein